MIAEVLRQGKNNAINGEQIARTLGVNLRTVQRRIESERREGKPICASSNGYFLADGIEELQAFYDKYTGTVKRRYINVKKIKQTLKIYPGQMRIEE